MINIKLPQIFVVPALLAALVTTAMPAAATVITLQTRQATDGPAPAGSDADVGQYYQDRLNALTAVAPGTGYCNTSLSSLSNVSNSSACLGPSQNIAFAYELNFGLTAGQAGNFSLQVGPDFGHGGAVFMDGALLAVRRDDLWWGGSYGNAGEIFSLINLGLTTGNHQLSIYGIEGCCDGAQSARFRLGNGDWTTFSSTDGLNLQQHVPEPAMPALVLTALALVGWTSGQRRRSAAAKA